MKRGRSRLLLAVPLALALAAGWYYRRAAFHPALAPSLPPSVGNPAVDTGVSLGGRPAPPFTLVNQFGQPVSLGQFRGKVVILAFLDSQCTTICPITSQVMALAQDMLGPAAGRVQLLGIDANPDATSVADVRAYSLAHGLLHRWDFLTGSPAALRRVWRAYGVYVAAVHGAIDHTPAVYVIDPRGREQRLYLTQMYYASVGQQAALLAREAARLLPGHPPVADHPSLAYIRGLGPGNTVHLPTAGPQRRAAWVTLGPSRPHLLLFFATWLRQTSPLARDLVSLNAYQEVAPSQGLPSLVAVDEATTESSPTALPRFLGKLSAPLRYPVVLDASGRLADGYGVQDQPWLVLTWRGRILWHHDGWLQPAALLQDVAAALRGHTGLAQTRQAVNPSRP